MKIALIGYGGMGKVIEEKAIARGHEIVLRVLAFIRRCVVSVSSCWRTAEH